MKRLPGLTDAENKVWYACFGMPVRKTGIKKFHIVACLSNKAKVGMTPSQIAAWLGIEAGNNVLSAKAARRMRGCHKATKEA